MKRIFLAIIIVIFGIIVTSFIRLSVPQSSVVLDSNSQDEAISLVTLSEHNIESDCWVGYDGKVYDVTSFLSMHPGSAEAIIPYCGTYDEFTEAFTKKHGTSKVSNLMRVGTLIGDFEIQGEI
ncbi:MAG: cytochrome b5-like heme/steroid binding domain-containing protein [Nanoarchaeota archaeon]